MTAPNIFKPRNDWNVITLRCKKLPETIPQKVRRIIREVTGVDPYIKQRTRKREFVQSRQLFCYFVKNYTKLSLVSIGSLLGGQDHCTVMYAIECVEKFKATEIFYGKIVQQIDDKINLK
jgi:chromosomal replication initiator protein